MHELVWRLYLSAADEGRVASSVMPPKRAERTQVGRVTPSASLSFDAPYLTEKLVKEHICTSEGEAQALFREVKRYLFLNRTDQSKVWEMYSLRIDEVWHQFVLFTRQYIDFCRRYYGAYLAQSQ